MIASFNPSLDIQPKVTEMLFRILEKDSNIQTYLFYGEEGRGKLFYALEFTKALFCTSNEVKPCNKCDNCLRINKGEHPDVFLIQPENYAKKVQNEIFSNPFLPEGISDTDKIKIEQIRQLKEFTKFKSFENNKRVIIINYFNKITLQAANAFLKLLEEPNSDLVIILISENKTSLLTTILSRIQLKIYFPPIQKEQMIELLDYLKVPFKEENLENIYSYKKFIKQVNFVTNYPNSEIVLEKILIVLKNIYKWEIRTFSREVIAIKELFVKEDKQFFEILLNNLYEILYKFFILGKKNAHKILDENILTLLNKEQKIKILEYLITLKKMYSSNVSNNNNLIEYFFFKCYNLCHSKNWSKGI